MALKAEVDELQQTIKDLAVQVKDQDVEFNNLAAENSDIVDQANCIIDQMNNHEEYITDLEQQNRKLQAKLLEVEKKLASKKRAALPNCGGDVSSSLFHSFSIPVSPSKSKKLKLTNKENERPPQANEGKQTKEMKFNLFKD